jgi:hypothetical protein
MDAADRVFAERSKLNLLVETFLQGCEPRIRTHNPLRQLSVGFIKKEDPDLKTRLRHIDIHHHWVRQESQNNNIHVQWIITSQMPDKIVSISETQSVYQNARTCRYSQKDPQNC